VVLYSQLLYLTRQLKITSSTRGVRSTQFLRVAVVARITDDGRSAAHRTVEALGVTRGAVQLTLAPLVGLSGRWLGGSNNAVVATPK